MCLSQKDLYFLPNQIDRGQCKWLDIYFDVCGAPYQKLCEQLWELMVFSDSKLTNVSLNLTTDLRTEEKKFTSFLGLYKHWKCISSLTKTSSPRSPLKMRSRELQLVIYQAPSLALIQADSQQEKDFKVLVSEVKESGSSNRMQSLCGV